MFRKDHTPWLAIAIGILGATSTGSGQEIAEAPTATATSADPMPADLPHVETMIAEAISFERPGQYLVAAKIYEAAASTLDRSDPNALNYLSRAGLLSYYSGELVRARELFEDVGWRASAVGNTPIAAVAYEKAMRIALEQGDLPGAATLYLRSLPEEDREKLLERRNRRR
jgi:tetratricopeptide (TPR) repeat protein